jgi:hypothetical protein
MKLKISSIIFSSNGKIFDMSLRNLTNWLTQYSWYVLIIGASFIALSIIAFLTRRYLKRTVEYRTIKRIVKGWKGQFLNNVVLRDGIDSYIFIDYLIKLPNLILAINTYNYEGYLFGGDSLDQWAQLARYKSYKFDNPLYRLRESILVLKNRVKDTRVEGRIVFSNNGSFPKGMPTGVVLLDALKDDISQLATSKNGMVSDAIWESLKREIELPPKGIPLQAR